MRHEQLWAPWRIGYILNADRQSADADLELLPGADRECFLCRAAADSADRENLLVERSSAVMTVLNRYPYNNGHLLIAPCAHKARLDQLDAAEVLALQQAITRFVALLERLLGAQGFNVGLNLGRPAGAGVPGHLHWHVVPRWNGDTNFMAVLGGVDVIPQSLDALWSLLVEELQKPTT